MNKRTLIISLASIFLFAPWMTNAQKNFPDVIEFDGTPDGGGSENIHPSTYTGSVQFSHKKHYYSYDVGCTACHHDSNAVTITKSESSESLRCGNCHLEEGLIRGPIAENAISDEDLIDHRANALHLLCIGCHKKHNGQIHVVRAPEACRICHAKRPQDWIIK